VFDVDGKVLETPGEGRRVLLKIGCASRHIQFKSWAACCLSTWAGAGAVVARYDVLRARMAGGDARAIVNCNYFQMIENSVDQNHLKWLHRADNADLGNGEIKPQSSTTASQYLHPAGLRKNWAHLNFSSCRRSTRPATSKRHPLSTRQQLL